MESFNQHKPISTRWGARFIPWVVAVLGLSGGFWLTSNAIVPQVAQAYTARVDVEVTRGQGESFEAMVRRAEAIARTAAQRSFDRDILVTDVAITILGQNGGAIAPILRLQATRQQWRSRPDPQIWATYFSTTRALLQFEAPTTTVAAPAAPATTTAPVAPQPATTPTTPAPVTTVVPNDPSRAPATTPQRTVVPRNNDTESVPNPIQAPEGQPANPGTNTNPISPPSGQPANPDA